MSEFYKHTYLTKNAQQKQLLNTLVGNHDLICCCDEPLKHIFVLIAEKAKPTNFTEQQKKLIKQCLGEEDTAGDQEDHTGFDIDSGDLEKLFADDDGEEG